MLKIEGLDGLARELDEAKAALSSIDGELGTVKFDPDDPVSIEAAIAEMERIIDSKLGDHLSNALIAPLAEDMKRQYRTAILDRAAEVRAQGDAKHDE